MTVSKHQAMRPAEIELIDAVNANEQAIADETERSKGEEKRIEQAIADETERSKGEEKRIEGKLDDIAIRQGTAPTDPAGEDNPLMQTAVILDCVHERAGEWGPDNVASGLFALAEGWGTTATGKAAHAEGRQTQAISDDAHAEGNATTASAQHSHAEGWSTTAKGTSSHAEGTKSQANEQDSHAEGNNTHANGRYSHAEGNDTYASGESSHAEGRSSKATSLHAHAEGINSTASGSASHAEGNTTNASGNNSHAEGWTTSANGNASHAEGNLTRASSDNSHAEGSDTAATGKAAHAEGYSTSASGDNSHAEGLGTSSTGQCQHVQGKYNATNNSNLAHIIGGGSSVTDLRNINEVDWDGNCWFSGDVTCGTSSTRASLQEAYDNRLTDSSVSTARLANGAVTLEKLETSLKTLLQSIPSIDFGTSNTIDVPASSHVTVDVTFGSPKTEAPLVFCSIQQDSANTALLANVQSVTNAQASIVITNPYTTDALQVTLDWLVISGR